MYNKYTKKNGGDKVIVLRVERANPSTKLLMFFALVFFSLFNFALFSTNITNATSINSDLNVKINEVLAIGLINCDGTNNSVVSVNVTPNSTGVFKSNCQTVEVDTNAPGYTLTAKAEGSNPNYDSGNITNNLLYLNPINVSNFTNGFPFISTTTNTITNPSALNNDTWGFAVEGLNSTDTVSNEASNPTPNFDTTYTIDNQNNKFAELPTADTTIYKTSVFPLPEVEHTFYYGTRLTTNTVAGTYATTVTYTAVGEVVIPPPTTCNNSGKAPECIEFTIDLTTAADGTYAIPTSSMLNLNKNEWYVEHTYDWDVYVDGYLTDIATCNNGRCAGTGAIYGEKTKGITLTGLTNGQHQILIVPHDEPIPGWGNAFGYNENSDNANSDVNKQKLISLDAPLTTLAFSPKVEESTTSASFMFGQLFYDCRNLTTTATFIDTYKLPSTITNLANLFDAIHNNNSLLSEPIDLSPLSGWINDNNSITNLEAFFIATHWWNTNLQSSIDFSPISDWFNNNNTITNLSAFLSYTHTGNTSLSQPIDLKPFSNWFNNNTSITDLGHIFTGAHSNSSNIETPINLIPLHNWFADNRAMSNLDGFMLQTHQNNPNLNLTGQVILPSWVKTMTRGATPIYNTSESFLQTFYTGSAKSGDTGEVRFEDDTPLSSIGTPSTNRQTYTNRTGITPVNNYWK